MNSLSSYKTVETFHLIFLRFLEQSIPKKTYALKGGCNLRFFFKSIRYSEDIDLDVWELSGHKLKDRVEKIFHSNNFVNTLLARKIELINLRSHKQTDTTQRWKMSLQLKGSTQELPTKIEFSRRENRTEETVVLEAVDPEVTNSYHMAPLLITHYRAAAAYEQKLNALLNRKKTQSRDIFDLHLLSQQGITPLWQKDDLASSIPALTNRILSIDYEVFHSQVVAFLQPSFQDYYNKPVKWEEIQLYLIDYLENLK